MPTGDLGELAGRKDRIVLAGIARSGTSWLGRAMAAAQDTRFYYEPDNVDADPTGRRPPGGQGFGPYPILRSGDDAGPYQALWDVVFSGRLPKRRGAALAAARTVLKLPRPIRGALIKGSSRVLTALPASNRTVVKTIYAVFSLDWLTDRYQPRVVVLQRDPLNVVSSWRQLQIPLFDLATRSDVRTAYLEQFGLAPPGPNVSALARIAWHVGLLTTVLGDALDRHPTWLLVEHENLCADPAPRMRAVFDRAGIPWSPSVERFLVDSDRPGEGLQPVRVTRDQPSRWRSRLSGGEIDEIADALAQFPRQGWVRKPPVDPAGGGIDA